MGDSSEHQFDPYDEVSSLVRGVAHEINNPMTFIRTNAENLDLLVRELKQHLREFPEEDPEEMSVSEIESGIDDALNGIRKGIGRINKVVDDFRDLATGGTEFVEIDLEDLVDTAVELGGFTVENLGSMTVEYDDGVRGCTVSGNKMKLEKTIINLLSNAAHAIEDRFGRSPSNQSGRVAVTVERTGGDGAPTARIAVSDNGTGVPSDLEDKIFSPFVTTKEQGRGTGLGLSQSLSIAREHGGDLRLEESEQEEGATFVLEIPLRTGKSKSSKEGEAET